MLEKNFVAHMLLLPKLYLLCFLILDEQKLQSLQSIKRLGSIARKWNCSFLNIVARHWVEGGLLAYTLGRSHLIRDVVPLVQGRTKPCIFSGQAQLRRQPRHVIA
jgi:hypothetical protein